MSRHLFAACLIVVTACAAKNDHEIVIGEYGSMTGPEATFGVSVHNGVAMALDEVNEAGGIGGRKVRLISEDDQSKAEEAASVVTKLISADNVMAIIGEVASSNSLAAAPICQANKVPMITPSSTNPKVTQRSDYIFRMCFIDTYQGPVLARFAANDLHARRVAVFTDVRSDYSTGLAAAFEPVFTSSGGTIVAHQSYAKGDNDFHSQLTTIKAAKPDVVLVPGYYNDVAPIVVQAREIGLTMPFIGGDGWESPKLLEIGGEALDGCMYSNHYHSDDPAPAVRDFVMKYEKRYGSRPDSLAALGYDTMRVLADAMRRAGPKFGSRSLRDALATTSNFAAVTGNITLDAERNPVGKRVVIQEIRSGKIALRTVIDPSRKDAANAVGDRSVEHARGNLVAERAKL